MSGAGRRRWAVGLSAAALLLALVAFVPMPTFSLWLVHLVLLEVSLAIFVLGVIALVLGLRTHRLSRLAALAAMVLGALPLLAAIPAFIRERQPFSVAEYVRGVSADAGSMQQDLVLDASRPQLTADLYRPRGKGPSPFVVAIHGGSWHGGAKGAAKHVSRFLASRGYGVLDVNYRLAPEHPFPAAIGDVKCLLGRFRERAGEYGIDPSRAALLGRSAGGEIALVAAYSAGDSRLPPTCSVEDRPVKAVVSIYGSTDLVDGYEHPIVPDIVDARVSVQNYLHGSPHERSEAYRLGSPISWVGRPTPPTLLIHGSLDGIVRPEQSIRLAQELGTNGRRVQLLMIPLAEHGFDERPGGIGDQLARGVLTDFLKQL